MTASVAVVPWAAPKLDKTRHAQPRHMRLDPFATQEAIVLRRRPPRRPYDLAAVVLPLVGLAEILEQQKQTAGHNARGKGTDRLQLPLFSVQIDDGPVREHDIV